MSVAKEADAVVNGDRATDYGSPLENLGRTADLWSPILGIKVTPEQVGLCMIALKIARQTFRYKHDNLVDICGYAVVLQKLHTEQQTAAALDPKTVAEKFFKATEKEYNGNAD